MRPSSHYNDGRNSFLCSTTKYGSIAKSHLDITDQIFLVFHRTIPVQYDSLQPCSLKHQPTPETYLPLSSNSMPSLTGSSPGPKRKAGGRLEPYFWRPQLTRFFFPCASSEGRRCVDAPLIFFPISTIRQSVIRRNYKATVIFPWICDRGCRKGSARATSELNLCTPHRSCIVLELVVKGVNRM